MAMREKKQKGYQQRATQRPGLRGNKGSLAEWKKLADEVALTWPHLFRVHRALWEARAKQYTKH